MKSRSQRHGPHVSKRKLKVKIIQKVREGVFDRNPLLATPHAVECKTCGCLQKITYLEYLKTGKFELGKTKTIEVAYAAPTLLGLNYIPESITPLLIQIECRKCRAKISCCPASLEYLMFTARKQVKSDQTYV
ncbi:MAG: hypothetical protein OEX77_01135 [Candidatus Bathyarchaeota archaeon]|nr:hypothetical protein [Candidatus Bathyarchaeota archaeon]MDH5732731.1 hypothetical protein [Candidatus Bathyarchaeota archaeon]